MRKYFYYFFCLFIFFLLKHTSLQAQGVSHYDPLHPPNKFRSKENPYYWKNRPPYPGYWQQDIYYNMRAVLNDRTDIITGDETLTYWNNSPDTLPFVYFHLYQNAFIKGSHLGNLDSNNNVNPIYGHYEKVGLGEKVDLIEVGGQQLKTEMDNTVMRAYLPKPLIPGDSVTFHIKWRTFYDKGTDRRRMKIIYSYGNKQYDGAQWYPRLAAYDRRKGWDVDQHLNREFYGDFGAFDLQLTLPANYIVEATGYLQNRNEVMPDSLRRKLDIYNFLRKPLNSAPSVIIPYDSTKTKTWIYHAENVHDVVWTADPTYRIGETSINGVDVISMVQEPHASRWWNAASYTAAAMAIYMHDFGPYAWNKIVVCDAQDGMEYPMVTLDGGLDPDYRSTLVHEVGHMWFFGQVGNNETYRAALDEGFTQFLTAWSLEKIDGKTMFRYPYINKYYNHFKKPEPTRFSQVYYGYIRDAMQGKDEPLNQHSDAFNGALGHGGGYNNVYYKMATLLYNLQYTLGDSLFQGAIKHYFNQWKFCHPYFEDVRKSFSEYTHTDLDWFFDQWMETTKNIDYSITHVRKGSGKDNYVIEFKRRGRMDMPIDFTVIAKDGKRYNYYVPNTWFPKKTDATILPKWYGWDKLHPTYKAYVTIPGGIKNVIIDTSGRLADINRLNNYEKTPVDLTFDSQIGNYPQWDKYEIRWRPDAWYNNVDALKLGLHLDGDYMNYQRIFSFTGWLNTSNFLTDKSSLGLVSGNHEWASGIFYYQTPFKSFIKNSNYTLNASYVDGLITAKTGINISANDNNKLSLNYQTLYRPYASDLDYLPNTAWWNYDKFNSSFNLAYTHTYRYFKGSGNINIEMRSSGLFSDYSYAYARITVVNKNKLGKLDFNTRTFAQYGTGSNWAPESELYLGGANPEELMDNKYTRAVGIPPFSITGPAFYGHFQEGGGLDLRGAGMDITGSSGVGENIELEFDRLIKFAPHFTRSWLKMDAYVFADGATISSANAGDDLNFDAIYADAGPGAAFTIKHFWVLEKVKPLTVRLDFPLLLYQSNANLNDMAKFRWVIGINRAF